MQTEANREVLRRIMEEERQGKRNMDEATIREMIDRLPNFQVSIRVVSQKGICLGGHRVGEEWLLKGRRDGWRTPTGMCMFAFDALYPSIHMLMFGGSYPWSWEPDVWRGPCPDPLNPVVFELRRLPED